MTNLGQRGKLGMAGREIFSYYIVGRVIFSLNHTYLDILRL